MTIVDFYKDLDFTTAHDLHSKTISSDFEEFRHLGIDKVYFSGDYPAIFFKEVKQFDEKNLKEIALAHHLAWNYRKVMFLFAVSPSEIRIYNCCKKPFNYNKLEIDIQEQTRTLQLIAATNKDQE